jgi:hypothetical protein
MRWQLRVLVPVLAAWCLLGLAPPAKLLAEPSDKPGDGKVYIICNVHSGKRLAVADGSKEPNGKIVQDESTKTHVTWRLEKVGENSFRLVNTSSDLSLDVPGKSKDEGVQIEQWTTKTEDTSNQEWVFIKRGHHYAIRSVDSQLVLAVENRSKDNGAAVRQVPLKDEDESSQLWILIEVVKKEK